MVGLGKPRRWEESPGAAARSLAHGYSRRRPEKTVLYEVVREELESFLAEAREDGKGLPRYVEKEFRDYLKCGQLEHG